MQVVNQTTLDKFLSKQLPITIEKRLSNPFKNYYTKQNLNQTNYDFNLEYQKTENKKKKIQNQKLYTLNYHFYSQYPQKSERYS